MYSVSFCLQTPDEDPVQSCTNELMGILAAKEQQLDELGKLKKQRQHVSVVGRRRSQANALLPLPHSLRVASIV